MKITVGLCLLFIGLVWFAFGAAGCDGGTEQEEPSGTVIPTVYHKPVMIDDMDAWAGEVVKGGSNNDDPTENGVVVSPYYALKINDTAVPVYTTRCGNGTHTFAWVDIEGAPDEFNLHVELTTVKSYKKVIVLPEKSGVTASIAGTKITASIKRYGDYSFAFSTNDTRAPSPLTEPLTVYVAPEEPPIVPEGWNVVTFKPGEHSADETIFTEGSTVYKFAKGDHRINSIKLPSDSVLHLEQGAYLEVYETGDTRSVVEIVDVSNVKILGRGLFDFSGVDGGDDKKKHPFTVARSENIEFSGITSINANTWTMCFYASENLKVTRNMLFGFRTYSDGIMMSDCVNGYGAYNFVRTGDDAVEVKATGWWQTGSGKMTGKDILYEHNSVWTDKGSAYGVIWENDLDFSGVTFRNNSVGFATATWNEYNNALDIRLGYKTNTVWENILFENIEIYECWKNAMTITLNGSGGIVRNAGFKNITVKNNPNAERAIRIQLNQKNAVDYRDILEDVVFENINFAGKKLTDESKNDRLLVDITPFSDDALELITIK
jgi:hypothetical protein